MDKAWNRIRVVDNLIPKEDFNDYSDLFYNEAKLESGVTLQWGIAPYTVNPERRANGVKYVPGLEKPLIEENTLMATTAFHDEQLEPLNEVQRQKLSLFTTAIQQLATYFTPDEWSQLELARIKVNNTFINSPEHYVNGPHKDPRLDNGLIIIWYMDNSDGYTFLFNETGIYPKVLTVNQRVKSQANKAIFFPGNMWHGGGNPVTDRQRILVNFNIRPKKGSSLF